MRSKCHSLLEAPRRNEIDLLSSGQFRDGGLRDNFLRHLTGVVVSNLPFSVFESVNEGVSGLDLVTGSSHGELVDTVVHGPVVSDSDVGLQDGSLRFLLAEVNEVRLDGVVVSSGNIRNSRQQARSSDLGVSGGNLIGVKGGQSTVPELEQVLDFLFGDGGRGGRDGLRHLTGVVVGNLPLAVFVHVNEGVSGLDLVAGGSKGEFVNTDILAPVGSDGYERFQDFSLRLLEEEGVEIVDNLGVVVTRDIRDGRQQDTVLGVSGSNQRGVAGGQSIVPQVEKSLDFFLLNRSGNVNSLRHDTGVVVRDLPLVALVDVNVRVSGLDLVSGGSHGEFVDSVLKEIYIERIKLVSILIPKNCDDTCPQ